MLSAVARGEVYILADDVMNHYFWIDIASASRYGNQLLLPARVTDNRGNIITGDAMVIYDVYYGNINLIHYGNYCIFAANWAHSTGHALIAQTGPTPEKVTWQEDYVYLAYLPAMSFDNKLSPPAIKPGMTPDKQDILFPVSETGPEQDNAINAVAAADAPHLTSDFGDRYYPYATYRIGDRNFEFYVCTIIVQSSTGPADGLVFFQKMDEGSFAYNLVIIMVFESEWVSAYSMAGIFDVHDSSWRGHYFVFISHGQIAGSTTVY